MGLIDLPIFSAMRTRMQWHQERQRVLSENVSNSDTPNFRPRDLAAPKFDAPGPMALNGVALARTDASHITGAGLTSSKFAADRRGVFEIRPAGNAVNLEDEMMKVAQNQMDYQSVTSLYTRSLGLMKTAIGKR